MIVYLHGFNSSPLSSKGVLMAEFCAAAGVECVVPQLPHRPAAAIALVRGVIDDALGVGGDADHEEKPVDSEDDFVGVGGGRPAGVCLGSRLRGNDGGGGGNDGLGVTVVGSSMGGYYAAYLCSVYPQLRAVLINPAVKLADKLKGEVGKVQKNYHNDEEYVFTEEHLREFAALDVDGVSNPARCLLMVQKGDEVLDYREAVEFYDGAQMVVEEGGDHSFVGFADHLQRILDFHRWVK